MGALKREPGGWKASFHDRTGARNMTEHRSIKRQEARDRQAQERYRDLERELKHAQADAPAPPAKMSRRKKRKRQGGMSPEVAAELKHMTDEWLTTSGPGYDF
jgi:hypothetical protein